MKSHIMPLQGRHLRLRPSQPSDAPIIFTAYQDPEFLRLYSTVRKVPESIEQVRHSLEQRQKTEPLSLGYVECVLEHPEKDVIGIMALNNYDKTAQQAEFLIGIFKAEHRHFYYGIEGTLLALELAFKYLKFQRIYSLVYDYNPTAEQQLQKLGFQLDNLYVNSLYSPHEKRHTIVRSLLLTRAELLNARLQGISQRLLGRAITPSAPVSTPILPAASPFSCSHTSTFPELLEQLGCSLILSATHTGRIMLLSSTTEKVIQLPRAFMQPTGLAVSGHRLAIATQNQVIVLANAPHLASAYPNKPNTYDALYVPRASYYSGELNIHDMSWGDEGLWAINSRFSCLSLMNDEYSFIPRWQPPFIASLAPNDACHLNGLAMEQGEPCYVTALGSSSHSQGWRAQKMNGGMLFDVKAQRCLVEGLSMPHSPRLYDGQLYVLNSAAGELLQIDRQTGQREVVNVLPGFARGMARCGDYVFIAVSQLRHKTAEFKALSLAKRALFCGVVIVHLSTGQIMGHLSYLNTCEEINDIQVLPKMRRPGILNLENALYQQALSTPQAGFWGQRGSVK